MCISRHMRCRQKPQQASDELLEIWVVTGADDKYDTFDIDYNHTTMDLDPKDDDMQADSDSDCLSEDKDDDLDVDDRNHVFVERTQSLYSGGLLVVSARTKKSHQQQQTTTTSTCMSRATNHRILFGVSIL